MKIQKHNLIIEKTAKYCQLGTLHANTKHIWIVLHGYGQLANYFIQNFEEIADEETVIIAPEGLSKFYLKGFYGRVGASWMTKEDRLTDIENYCDYLNQLYIFLLKNVVLNNIKITVLGFSQGGATASRWLEKSENKINNLILWSSIFPNDMKISQLDKIYQKYNCTLVYGTQDPFIGQEHKNQIQSLNLENKHVKIITFEGEHKIHSETLIKIKVEHNI